MTARLATARMLVAASLLALSLAACQDGSGINGPTARKHRPDPGADAVADADQGDAAIRSDPDPRLQEGSGDGGVEARHQRPVHTPEDLSDLPLVRPARAEGDSRVTVRRPRGSTPSPPGLMNPNSSYYLSFDTGFPNAFDRANGRSGNYLMVHGTCSSAGCFAMTDASIAEIYAVAREAFIGGQRSFQFQSYPFRMTAQNMAKFRNDPKRAVLAQISRKARIISRPCTRSPRSGSVARSTCSAAPTPPRVRARRSSNRWSPRSVRRTIARSPSWLPKARRRCGLVYQDGGQNPGVPPAE